MAFDAASNATMGMGKVALQEFNARDPAVFSPRYETTLLCCVATLLKHRVLDSWLLSGHT